MKRFLGIAAVALLIIAGAAWFLSRPAPDIYWQGYAEADFLRIGPTLAGKLTHLAVARGDSIANNGVLFTQDAVPDMAARDQASAQLHQAEAVLANLQNGAKPTEIAAATADVADAAANAARAGADLARRQALVRSGAVARAELDQAAQAANSAAAHLAAANARLAQARAPAGRTQEITGATMAVAAAQGGLDQAEWRVTQRDVRSPTAGRITDVFARAGETIGAGSPVVELLPPENILVRFFVPENTIGMLHRGDAVRIACDGCAGLIGATISFIAPNAEYTPPVIYSNDTRAKLVFLVEARPAPADATKLNPGQPVTVQAGQVGRPVAPP